MNGMAKLAMVIVDQLCIEVQKLFLRTLKDQSISRNVSMDVSFKQVKGSAESSCPSPAKLSLSLPSTSLAASPMSSQSHLPPATTTPFRWPCHSPEHQVSRHVSYSKMPVSKSPSSFCEERPMFPSWSNESARRSCGGSSNGWSTPGFSEPMGTSPRARQSFDIESFGYNCELNILISFTIIHVLFNYL